MTNAIKIGLQLVYLPIMAKLLVPADFGLYALASPILIFTTALADGGLGASLAREPESSKVVWSTAFWVLLATGFGFAFLVCVSGFIAAALFHQPRLSYLIALMSTSLIFMTLTIPAGARLTRRGQLATGATSDLIASVLGSVIAVIFASQGAGAGSLAVQYVIAFAMKAILINYAAFEMPDFVLRLSSLRPHFATGATIIGTKLVDFIERLGGNALLTSMLGTSFLGYYSFSTQISKTATEAPASPVWAVLYVNALSGDRERTACALIQLCRLLGLVLLPGSIVAAVLAPQTMMLVLGPKWVPAATVLAIILPSYAANAIFSQFGALLLAYGRNDVAFWSTCLISAGRLIALSTAGIFGIYGVAIGVAAANFCYCFTIMVFAANIVCIEPVIFLRSFAGPVVCGMIAGAAVLTTYIAIGPSLAEFLLSVVVGIIVLILTLFIVEREHIRFDLVQIRKVMKSTNTISIRG